MFSKSRTTVLGMGFTLVSLFTSALPSSAFADLVALPDSHHQQFETYGLYIDEQTALLYRDSGRGWGAVGGTIALLGNEEWFGKPQLVAHASANAAYQLPTSGATLQTQTIDARVGLGAEFTLSDTLRFAITWTHQSGHTSDNVPDVDLFGSNLGNEIIEMRLIKDIDEKWRVGGSLRPTVSSDPGMVIFGANQFAEYFPFSEGQTAHEFKPYIAAGFEEYGRNSLRLSSNVEVGFAAGSHFKSEKHSSLRVLIGYYNGNDPRLKYYQFKFSRQAFGYGGLAFDI